ncbi:hypothetical protein B0H12DRAFT_1236395 [Mycena haematopus]|nr:hypothetical protein B0H12DRAFT_1236395 [Mycena haematopus]
MAASSKSSSTRDAAGLPVHAVFIPPTALSCPASRTSAASCAVTPSPSPTRVCCFARVRTSAQRVPRCTPPLLLRLYIRIRILVPLCALRTRRPRPRLPFLHACMWMAPSRLPRFRSSLASISSPSRTRRATSSATPSPTPRISTLAIPKHLTPRGAHVKQDIVAVVVRSRVVVGYAITALALSHLPKTVPRHRIPLFHNGPPACPERRSTPTPVLAIAVNNTSSAKLPPPPASVLHPERIRRRYPPLRFRRLSARSSPSRSPSSALHSHPRPALDDMTPLLTLLHSLTMYFSASEPGNFVDAVHVKELVLRLGHKRAREERFGYGSHVIIAQWYYNLQ